jgi:hypothetical protein
MERKPIILFFRIFVADSEKHFPQPAERFAESCVSDETEGQD